jgi:hypothetical protein
LPHCHCELDIDLGYVFLSASSRRVKSEGNTMDHGLESLVQFADVLLPGDDLFPSASASGMAEMLLGRLRDHARLLAAIAAAGGPLAPLSSPERAAVVARL